MSKITEIEQARLNEYKHMIYEVLDGTMIPMEAESYYQKVLRDVQGKSLAPAIMPEMNDIKIVAIRAGVEFFS